MTKFDYRQQQLYVENLPLKQIAAQFGTPCYVYSADSISENYLEYANILKNHNYPAKIFYAVKANSNLAILQLLATLGAGFDAVSGGEIDRILAAGCEPSKIVFSGVGKSIEEINKAIDLNISSIHIESEAELIRIQEIAKHKSKTVNIAFRVNPDVDAQSHPYISTGSQENKFGIDHNDAIRLYKLANNMPNLKIKGISCHIGSQITSLEPFLSALNQILHLIDQLKTCNIHIEYLDFGGGLGVCYKNETPPSISEYISAILKPLKKYQLELHLEPGRSIIANAGVLLSKVEYIKHTGTHNFAVVDAAMNDLIRPALYSSYHDIIPVELDATSNKICDYTIVGPVCESGDFFGRNRQLAIKADDLLAIKSCGAYGFSMSSNYNTRPRCPEVLVIDDQPYLIRKRETFQELIANENLINVR